MFLIDRLNERENLGILRSLPNMRGLIDFSSNDYLGFARSEELFESILQEIQFHKKLGSTGSRLLSGNSRYCENLEHEIALHHQAEAGLLFSSGYAANVGLLSAIATKDDTILFDRNIHASMRDGLVLSPARKWGWKHNDLSHLEKLLKMAQGNVFVCCESIYSVDGSRTPLEDLSHICSLFKAHLIVDEAHALGMSQAGLATSIKTFARIYTFGKALGAEGAIVVGSFQLKEFLLNFARSFIYSTAPSFLQLAAIKCGYEKLKNSDEEIKKLKALMNHLKVISPIVAFQNVTKEKWISLKEKGFDLSYLRYPTVPKKEEILRLSLHSYNTIEELDHLCAQL